MPKQLGFILIAVLAAAGIVVAVYACWPISWRESYRIGKKDPYDLYVMHELLRERADTLEVLKDSLQVLDLVDEDTPAHYVYVGANIYAEPNDIDHLLDFVERGHSAFIFSNYIPTNLLDQIWLGDCYLDYNYYGQSHDYYAYNYVKRARLRLNAADLMEDSAYVFQYHTSYKASFYSWQAFSPTYLCDAEFGPTPLGTINDTLVNFIRIPWGDGDFYLHSNPIAFTNYFLADTLDNQAYVAAVLSYLPPGGNIYWDEFSRSYRPPPPPPSGNNPQGPDFGQRQFLSPNHALSYILGQPGLAAAWFLLLGLCLLYLLFRGKRRQRIIPYLAPRRNDSRQFLETVARLGQLNGKHWALATEEVGLFWQHLYERHGIRYREGPQLTAAQLADRTGLSVTVWENALTQIRFVQGVTYLDDGSLLRFYRSLEPIYRS